MGKKNLGEAGGLSQIGCVLRSRRTTFLCCSQLLSFLADRFFLGRLFCRSLFYWSFLGGGFLLNWHSFSPLSLATAKIGENHVNNSLMVVNSSLRKIRQRIFSDFRLIFLADCDAAVAPLLASAGKISSAFATISSTFHKRPTPFVSAREHSFLGSDKLSAARSKRRHILLCCGMQPHFSVHCGRDEKRVRGWQVRST